MDRVLKQLAKYQRITPVAVLAASLSACATMSPRTAPLAISAASAGIATTDAALSAYDHLDSLYPQELRGQKIGNLLTAETADYSRLVTMSGVEEPQLKRRSKSIALRRRALRNLQETYRTFNKLAEGTFGAVATAATQRLNESIKALADARKQPLQGSAIPPG